MSPCRVPTCRRSILQNGSCRILLQKGLLAACRSFPCRTLLQVTLSRGRARGGRRGGGGGGGRGRWWRLLYDYGPSESKHRVHQNFEVVHRLKKETTEKKLKLKTEAWILDTISKTERSRSSLASAKRAKNIFRDTTFRFLSFCTERFAKNYKGPGVSDCSVWFVVSCFL